MTLSAGGGNRNARAPLDFSLGPTGGSARWNARLAPFDLQAIAISDTAARVADFRVRIENATTSELVQQIQEVRQRANSLRTPQSLSVLRNPGFELAEKTQPLAAWVHARGAGIQVAADSQEFVGGKQSLSLRSTGPAAWVAANRSRFQPPAALRFGSG